MNANFDQSNVPKLPVSWYTIVEPTDTRSLQNSITLGEKIGNFEACLDFKSTTQLALGADGPLRPRGGFEIDQRYRHLIRRLSSTLR